MGSVYLAVHPQIGKRVAIKVLGKHVLQNAEACTRFLREAQVVNRIGHPGMVDIFSFGQLPTGQHYLIMELLTGEPLSARMARGPMPWRELCEVFTQLLLALQAAHDAEVVHRDLKPDNVFLVSGRDKVLVKLLDFGLAKIVDGNSDMTHTGIALGTPRYMPPEQSRGGRHMGPRGDLYAVGLMLYEAVTGRFPFEAPTAILMLTVKLSQDPPPPSRHAEMPPALEALILRALQRAPEDRFGSAREMAAALQAIGGPDAPIELRRRSAGASQGQAPRRLAAQAGSAGRAPGPRQGEDFSAEETKVSPPRPGAPAAAGLSGEETKVSPPRPQPAAARVQRRQHRAVLLAAGCAVILGLLCGIVVRVGLLGRQAPLPPPAPAQAAPAPALTSDAAPAPAPTKAAEPGEGEREDPAPPPPAVSKGKPRGKRPSR
jgi:serine/threonine-protein kinase